MKVDIGFNQRRVDLFGVPVVFIDDPELPELFHLFQIAKDKWMLLVSKTFLPEHWPGEAMRFIERVKGEKYNKLAWDDKEFYLKSISRLTTINKFQFFKIDKDPKDGTMVISQSLDFFTHVKGFSALALWEHDGQ